MKNIFLLLVFCLIISLISSAQKMGIKAGANFSSVIAGKDNSSSGSSSSKSESKNMFVPAYHAGLFTELDLGSSVSVQMEAVYSVKGFKQIATTTSNMVKTSLNMKYTFSYVDVPVIFNIHFGQEGSYIGIGPQLSFLTGAQWYGSQTTTYTNSAPPPLTGTTSSFTSSGNSKDGYSKTNFGATLGFGSKWDSGFEYCIRGAFDLTNLIDPSVSKSDAIWHNLVFSFSLGYGFGSGGGNTGHDRYGHKYKSRRR